MPSESSSIYALVHTHLSLLGTPSPSNKETKIHSPRLCQIPQLSTRLIKQRHLNHTIYIYSHIDQPLDNKTQHAVRLSPPILFLTRLNYELYIIESLMKEESAEYLVWVARFKVHYIKWTISSLEVIHLFQNGKKLKWFLLTHNNS